MWFLRNYNKDCYFLVLSNSQDNNNYLVLPEGIWLHTSVSLCLLMVVECKEENCWEAVEVMELLLLVAFIHKAVSLFWSYCLSLFFFSLMIMIHTANTCTCQKWGSDTLDPANSWYIYTRHSLIAQIWHRVQLRKTNRKPKTQIRLSMKRDFNERVNLGDGYDESIFLTSL